MRDKTDLLICVRAETPEIVALAAKILIDAGWTVYNSSRGVNGSPAFVDLKATQLRDYEGVPKLVDRVFGYLKG